MLCEQCGSLLLCRRHVVQMRIYAAQMSSGEVGKTRLGTCDAFSQFTTTVAGIFTEDCKPC
jgi:hypothetical protein